MTNLTRYRISHRNEEVTRRPDAATGGEICRFECPLRSVDRPHDARLLQPVGPDIPMQECGRGITCARAWRLDTRLARLAMAMNTPR